MTVIASLIGNARTVHATDSLLLSGLTDVEGARVPHHRSGAPKIAIPARKIHCRSSMSRPRDFTEW